MKIIRTDDNFKTILDTETKTIKTIARSTGEYSILEIGDRCYNGEVLTEKYFNELCEKYKAMS